MPRSILIESKNRINVQQIWKRLSLLNIEALKYAMLTPTGVAVYLHDDKELSDQDKVRVQECIDKYEIFPDVNDLRKMREPLLHEVDWRINRAQDNNEDISALVEYRKALRDITKNYNDSPVEWPVKPW